MGYIIITSILLYIFFVLSTKKTVF